MKQIWFYGILISTKSLLFWAVVAVVHPILKREVIERVQKEVEGYAQSR